MMGASPRMLKALVCALVSFSAAQACGPEFFADTFVHTWRPDEPEQYVRGKLGLLQGGFARADLFVAYRYLNGGTLNGEEQTGWAPTYALAEQYYGLREERGDSGSGSTGESTPLARWLDLRKSFGGSQEMYVAQEATIEVHLEGDLHYESSFLNCADDAFRVAGETLKARAKTWGEASPYLLDWLHAQDVVFGNCAGSARKPAETPVGSPALLVRDRAYQVAAAHFYGQEFEAAAEEFRAIGRDGGSPWQPVGGYLAARALVREAFRARPTAATPAEYDAALMRAAEDELRGYLAAGPAPGYRRAAEALLALVRVRLEPKERTRELAALVAGPGHDENYAQDVKDLLWVTEAAGGGLRARPQPYAQVQDEAQSARALAPMLDWVDTVRGLTSQAHAVERWRATQSLPWLMAAMMVAEEKTSGLNDLLRAAAAVPASSPAWMTVNYHRARLLIVAGRVEEAQAVLAELSVTLERLPEAERLPSAVNAVRGLKMLAAGTAEAFFSFAPRAMLLEASEEAASVNECREVMKDPARHYACVSSVGPEQLDGDAAGFLNQASLGVWLRAAGADAFSAQLRGAIAMEGWTRAVLLEDAAEAKLFVLLLPQELRAQAGEGSPLAPWMTLARNPGLRPYVNAGVQRAYSYDFVESYRDNWCYRPEESAAAQVTAAFVSLAERQKGFAESRRLAALRSVFVGQKIVAGVEADVHDEHAAEALYLVLRMVRYGCMEAAAATPGPADAYRAAGPFSEEAQELLQLKEQAARLLRRYYATSPWTRKAAPLVG